MNGYWHPDYAQSFAEFGRPRELHECGGWILERTIPGFADCDAMGCYPLFVCADWSRLATDLNQIGTDLVSLTVVSDPFGDYDEAWLRRCFPDLVIPFKEHYVIDLRQDMNKVVSTIHRYNARRALKDVRVEVCHEPLRFLDEWCNLYQHLIEKHDIRGLRAFSRTAFAKQLSVPGLVMFRAVAQATTVGAFLCFVHGDVSYFHLGCSSPLGYRFGASYALVWSIIEYYAGRVRWINLMGNAGVRADHTGSLSFFKRGWTHDTRTAYLCGRIFDRERYEQISQRMGVTAGGYFPAYRKGEFA